MVSYDKITIIPLAASIVTNIGDNAMKIVFLKISNMKYYKGVCKNDTPSYGGDYVKENGYGHEEYNFYPMQMEDSDAIECIGFAEPKSNKGTRNTFHIENIEGCSAMKNEPCVDNVLVVWCAKYNDERGITVVGWYKNATIFRELHNWIYVAKDGSESERCYNVYANADDCTLLPYGERNRHIWTVPLSKYTRSYGFGQSMVWYPTEPEATNYIEQLVKSIENYDGENWLDKYPET